MQHPPLDDGAVGEEFAAVPAHEDVDAAQGVVPVLVAEVPFEGRVQERPDGVEKGRGQLVGVRGVQCGRTGHGPSLPGAPPARRSPPGRGRRTGQYTVTPYAARASLTGWWMAEPLVPVQPELPEWMPRATEPAKCAPPLSPPAEQAVVRTML